VPNPKTMRYLCLASGGASASAALRSALRSAAFSSFLLCFSSGLYNAEIIHRRGPWRSFEAVEFATLEWVDWFNNRRPLESIGNIPPAEAEERYYAMLEQPAMAA
jgi:transposase InsO family protein